MFYVEALTHCAGRGLVDLDGEREAILEAFKEIAGKRGRAA